MKKKTDKQQKPSGEPYYWFAEIVRHRLAGNLDGLIDATERLRELGYNVECVTPKLSRVGAGTRLCGGIGRRKARET